MHPHAEVMSEVLSLHALTAINIDRRFLSRPSTDLVSTYSNLVANASPRNPDRLTVLRIVVKDAENASGSVVGRKGEAKGVC